ncbi:MAG: helix-turn-helix transcriptional regulator [Devosia sp.]
MKDNEPRKGWANFGGQPESPGSSAYIDPPPYPAVLDSIWLVFRLNRSAASRFVPPALTMSSNDIGVLGVYGAKSGSRLSPYTRAFCGVTINGYDTPDTKEAVCIVGDVVTPNASPAMRTHYMAAGLPGEPRIALADGLLTGTAETGGKEWLRVVVRPERPAGPEITGLDAYVSTSSRGLSRHVVSYYGFVAPAEVVSLTITDDAPSAFQALRPTEILLSLTAIDLHATWGEPYPVAGMEPIPSVVTTSAGDVIDMLRSVKLTPAEARLAALIGEGSSAKEAADKLGISEHTARSTLKQVYGKLGIRRRAELGHLIARLQHSPG